MMLNMDKFWRTTPNSIIKAIAITIVCLGIGLGVVIGQSSTLEISKEGFAVQRQAEKNQEELEQALTLIEIQRTSINQLEERIQKFASNHQDGKELIQEVERTQEIIPVEKVEGIKDAIQESKEVLHENSQMDVHRNIENKRPDS